MGDDNNRDIKEALDKFTSILEKFGLDIITKMGQTNLSIKMLTDKVNKLSEATIDVKALLPQLTNVIENQKILETELDLIRTLIQRSNISFQSKEIESETIKRDTSATDKKQTIIEQFNAIVKYINENDNPLPVIESLKRIKDEIYIYTGGHRILYEIGQFINRLNNLEHLPNDIKESLKEKITFWINKLSIKG
ncbi:MAG: hypothetical protein ACFFCI_05705 [Promethearchaeota archaeon]